jgi:hypothetical protein
MPRAALFRVLVFCHRWVGVIWCALFTLWFASGFVMMYRSYPEVDAADRLRRAASIDPARVNVSPLEAYASLRPVDPPDQVRLAMFDGRPLYRFRVGREQRLVYADDGTEQGAIAPELGLRVAAAWTGQPAGVATFDGAMMEVDQWTVAGPPRPLWPLLKYSWPNGEQLYVSAVSGEVVQQTTRASRMAAYFGAIPHWLYITPLRKHGALWRRIVLWGSGVGMFASLIGLVVGVWAYSPRRRYRRYDQAATLPYIGQKRWHAVLGLVFGSIACTWVFSGFLSMTPFEWLTENPAGAGEISRALGGGRVPLRGFAAKSPREALEHDAGGLQVRELELITFAGEPVYLATGTPGESRLMPVRFDPAPYLDPEIVTGVIAQAIEPLKIVEARVVFDYEAYYVDRHHELPLPVLFARLNDPAGSAYYIDLKTARIVSAYSSRARWNRWLYHGLHSWDLPWLYRHRPAWDIVVIALLLGGLSLSLTAASMASSLLMSTPGRIGRWWHRRSATREQLRPPSEILGGAAASVKTEDIRGDM